MRKAVLFDFDGTLMDTQPAIMASFRYLFKKYRTEEDFTPEIQLAVLGPSLHASISCYFPEHDTDRLEDEYRIYQRDHAMHTIVPMEHAVELVKLLHEQGYQVGLVSSRRHDSMEVVLQYLGLTALFDVLVGAEDLQREKPDPEGIHLAMKLLEADTAVYVGDSASDIQAGNNAGVPAIAYLSDERKKESLLAQHPLCLITDLMDVTKYL